MATQSLQVLRLTAPFAMAALCIWAVSARVELPSPGELWRLLAEIKSWQWFAAVAATAVSFWALGRYDSVAHRHLQTGLDSPQARKAGMAAIAFSQFAGFGLFTGAYARWRLVPGLTAVQAAQLTGLVALTFMAALTLLSGLAMLACSPGPRFCQNRGPFGYCQFGFRSLQLSAPGGPCRKHHVALSFLGRDGGAVALGHH